MKQTKTFEHLKEVADLINRRSTALNLGIRTEVDFCEGWESIGGKKYSSRLSVMVFYGAEIVPTIWRSLKGSKIDFEKELFLLWEVFDMTKKLKGVND